MIGFARSPIPSNTQPYYDPAIEALPRPQLEGLQLQRLQEQIQRVYDRSAFHRERFEHASVTPEDVRRLDDLRRLPFVTKDELRDEQMHHPPLGRLTTAEPAERRELHPTTGTTGRPVNAVWSASDLEYMVEVGARAFWAVGIRPGMIVQNALSYGLWAGGISAQLFAERIGGFVIPVGAAGGTDRQVAYLLDLGPHVLVATPSFALYLAERVAETARRADLRLEVGLFGGEPGTAVQSTRHALEEALGLKAFDYYGATEIGMSLASECIEQAGIHWPEDHVLVEVIDPATKEPVPAGDPGVMVLTHLSHTGFPLVRYWTNDLIRITPEPCRCGRTLARSPGGIVGRADDMLIFRGTNFYPTQVEKVVRSFGELGPEYRIELSHDSAKRVDRCVVQVEPRAERVEESGELARRIQEALRSELHFRPDVEIVPRSSLERTTFKARRVKDTRQVFAGGADGPR